MRARVSEKVRHVAEELSFTAASAEADEVIEVHWLPFDEAFSRAVAIVSAEDGIWDAKSVLAIVRAHALRGAAE